MSQKDPSPLKSYSYPYQDKDKYGVPANPKKHEEKENDGSIEEKPIPFKVISKVEWKQRS